MSNSKGIEQNNEYGITSYDPSQFSIPFEVNISFTSEFDF